MGDYLTGEGLDWISVTVNTGSICEVLEENGEIAHVLIVGIMRHEESVFFVVRWFEHTGQVHQRFQLKEYRLCNLFEYAAFLSLKAIDDQFFVHQGYFHHDKALDLYYLNDWVFNAV